MKLQFLLAPAALFSALIPSSLPLSFVDLSCINVPSLLCSCSCGLANLIVTRFRQDNEQVELGGSGLRLATKKTSSAAAAPFTLSETCGVGSYKCYGEGTLGGDIKDLDL
eukprot:scaffold399_cov79-Skeletonema_dohrnii-CCMP3373.AAC.3